MRKNKVTLVYPRSETFSPTEKPSWNLEHLGIAYLAASLEFRGYEVSLINASGEGLSQDDLLERIQRTTPDIAGFSVTAFTVKDALNIADRLKARLPSLHVCFGGQHATFCADDLLRDFASIDTVVRGDGEQTIVEIATAIEERISLTGIQGVWFRAKDGTVVKNPDRPGVHNLDTIRLPKRPRSSTGAAQFGVNTSRGCIYNCQFCTTPEYSSLSFLLN